MSSAVKDVKDKALDSEEMELLLQFLKSTILVIVFKIYIHCTTWILQSMHPPTEVFIMYIQYLDWASVMIYFTYSFLQVTIYLIYNCRSCIRE